MVLAGGASKGSAEDTQTKSILLTGCMWHVSTGFGHTQLLAKGSKQVKKNTNAAVRHAQNTKQTTSKSKTVLFQRSHKHPKQVSDLFRVSGQSSHIWVCTTESSHLLSTG